MTASETQSEIIRDLAPGDGPAISSLARRAFPVTQAPFVAPGKMGKIAEVDGRVVAACLLRILRLPGGRKVGFVAWLMTHPDFRGRGLARKLVGAGTRFLQSEGCETVLTDVEGYHTSSANVFHGCGYRRISLAQQLRKWNPVDLLWIWILTGFFVDPGHFLWATGMESAQAHPVRGWFLAVGFNTIIALTAFSLGGGLLLSGEPSLPSALEGAAFFLAITVLFFVRLAGLFPAAQFAGQALQYRAWTGGWGLSVFIALGFGSTFPLPGNLYPPHDGWDQRSLRSFFGSGALLSTMLLAVCVLLCGWLRGRGLSPFIDSFALGLLRVGKPLLLFDTLFAFAPFEGFHGRHLRDHKRRVQIFMSALALAVFYAA